MKRYEMDVELTAQDLFAFSMHHTYAAPSGILGIVVSVGALVTLAVKYAELPVSSRVALAVIGVLFTIVQPLMIYSKSRKQEKRSKQIKGTLHYSIDAEAVTISQGEEQAVVKWDEISKVVLTAKRIYLYTGPVRGFIFPADACGDSLKAMAEDMKKWMMLARQ